MGVMAMDEQLFMRSLILSNLTSVCIIRFTPIAIINIGEKLFFCRSSQPGKSSGEFYMYRSLLEYDTYAPTNNTATIPADNQIKVRSIFD